MSSRIYDLIEELNDGFCSVRMDGELIYANKIAKTLLKIRSTDSLNFFKNFLDCPDFEYKIKSFNNSKSRIKDIECNIINTSNEKIPVILTANLIKDIEGQNVGMAILFKDMTDLKDMHAQLLQAQKMESIGLLASGIAHEFNNILSGIIPNAELIKMTVDENSSNYVRADSVYKSATRAANIVKQLLSFARLEKESKLTSVNLYRLVTETLEIMNKLFGEDIIVENKLAVDLIPVKADSTRIQQVIMNLSINARDAIEGKGIIVFNAKPVHIAEAGTNNTKLLPGNYVKMSVADSGKGIHPEHLEKIFDPFFTTKEPGKGTGLGLSTVYGIVNSLKGDIQVHSETGKGTQFDIYLPVFEEKDKKTESKFFSQVESKTILVVDDEKLIREMAKDLLDYMGFKTIVAEGGSEALDKLKSFAGEIDLAVVDLIMPKINGVTCFRMLKKLRPDLPIIITSGVGETNKRKDMLEMGAVEYIQKPYDLNTLNDIFTKVFKNLNKNSESNPK